MTRSSSIRRLAGGTRLVVLMFLVASLVGCRTSGEQTAGQRVGSGGHAPGGASPDLASLVPGNTQFALDLYLRLMGREGNLFFSPYSISSALAMTYGGARGNTAKEMADVLGFTLKDDVVHASFGALTDSLNEKGKQGDFELSVANALWGHKGHKFLDSFLELNARDYGAGLNQVDFERDTEAARRTINTWVEKETRDKIKELIKPGMLSSATRLVLTNAIYFKGNWASKFEEKNTKDEKFGVGLDESVTTPMMHRTGEFGYMVTDAFQALELPYVGEDLSMVVLLPRETEGLGTLERSLAVESLEAWMAKLSKREVIVSLPKFKVTCEVGLAETLQAMGMKDAFRLEAADFSGMTGRKDLFIDAVVHKAYVDVNEEGTEAAAATGVMMKLTAVRDQPPVFKADHPFLFVIRENATGSILFMGRVMNPAA
jgi:serpin B